MLLAQRGETDARIDAVLARTAGVLGRVEPIDKSAERVENGGADRHVAGVTEVYSHHQMREYAEAVLERAKALYAQHPTYRGTTSMSWQEAPLAAKLEWIAQANEDGTAGVALPDGSQR